MSRLNTRLRTLALWLQQTRQQSILLDNEADTLLAQLQNMAQPAQYIDELSRQPLTLGLYGHSLASKNRLLKELCSRDGALWVISGEQKIDYFSQINPGRQQPDMAIRFTSAPLAVTDSAPVLLTLYSESEFARRLIYRCQCSVSAGELTINSLYSRLNALRFNAGPQPQPGMTCEQAMTTIAAWQRHVPPAHYLSAELSLQITALLPRLCTEDRAQLLAPFWGNNPGLTSAWLRHARTLQQMGGVTQVLAPATLLTESFVQSAERFLFAAQSPETGQRAMIFPLRNARPQAAQSLLINDLVSACAEVVLSLDSPSTTHNIEVVDIPLQQLDYYGERLQPDTLLVCNAARQPQEVQPAARMLLHWLKRTQADNASDRPRLIWAITSADACARLRQSDDSVQRIITRAGKEWGALQLFDCNPVQSLVEWFNGGGTLADRNQRQSALLQACNRELNTLFTHFSREAIPEEQLTRQLIRSLGNHIDRHGDLLTAIDLPHRLLLQCQALWQQERDGQRNKRPLAIDLFAEPQTHTEIVDGQDFAARVHKAWINHLRQLTPQHPLLQATELEPLQLRLLCDLLISFSYRYDLSAALRERLKQTIECREAEMVCAAAVISEFITWLGYASTAAQQRPLSRVNAPAAIFTPVQPANINQRLTQLQCQSLNHGTRWAYDWLVALHSRIKEQAEAGFAYGLSHPQLEALRTALIDASSTPCTSTAELYRLP